MQHTETPDDGRYATTGPAARAVDVADVTVRLWARLGILPCKTTTSGVRLFKLADVRRVARERAARRPRRKS